MNKEDLKNKFREVKETVKETFNKDTSHKDERSELRNKDYLGGAVDKVKGQTESINKADINRKAS